jgi:glycosyltransferase involved in cell wall biosynthesis
MTGTARVYVDVSYTRIQQGNVGITRTVRRLAAEFATLASCTPVAWHRSGFRAVSGPMERAPHSASSEHGWATRLFGIAHSTVVRRLAAMLPILLVRTAWAVVNALTFNRLSARDRRVRFAPGDLLVMADEAWNYPAWTAAAQAGREGARVVLMIHDLIPLRHPEFCDPLFSHVFGRWLHRMLACSHAVVCNSSSTEKDLHAWCGAHGVPLPPTGHFRLGSDLPAGIGRAPRPHVAAFLGGGEPCFAAIGTIEPRKNHAVLLAVFEQLWAAGNDVRLLVAGRAHPESSATVRRLLAHPEQGLRLLTLLDASDEEISMAYSTCRALVLASLAEGFGLPLVEARTRGCPVIASNLPALAELADEGVHLFEPGSVDKLKALIVQQAKNDARAHVAPMPPFTWRDSARQCLDVISRLAETPVPVSVPVPDLPQRIRT